MYQSQVTCQDSTHNKLQINGHGNSVTVDISPCHCHTYTLAKKMLMSPCMPTYLGIANLEKLQMSYEFTMASKT